MPRTGMYVPLDVCFYLDDAVLDVSAGAELLFVRGLAACKQAMTDGYISRGRLATFSGKLSKVPRLVAELIDAGLWSEAEGGWQIRAWLEHNETAAALVERRDAERAASAARQRAYRARNGVTNGVTEASRNGAVTQEKRREEKYPPTPRRPRRATQPDPGVPNPPPREPDGLVDQPPDPTVVSAGLADALAALPPRSTP